MQTFAQITTPETPDQLEARLLNAFQGVGFVVQIGADVQGAPVGSGNVAIAGPPAVAANLVVLMGPPINPANPPTLGNATFSWSSNGGFSYPPAQSGITVPSSGVYAIPSLGVTLTFDSGYFQSGEQYAAPLTTPSFPINDWSEGGTYLTITDKESEYLSDLSSGVANATKGGLTSLASGDFLQETALNFYTLLPGHGQQTIGLIEMILAAGAGPYNIVPGQLTMRTRTGQLYTNMDAFTIKSSGTPDATLSPVWTRFQASSTGAIYNQPSDFGGSGCPFTLVAGLPGLSIDNPPIPVAAAANSPSPAIVQIGPGNGAIAISGTANGDQLVITRIFTSGPAGSAYYQVSLDGGTTYLPASGTPCTTPLSVAGLTVTFGAGTFTQGTRYLFSTTWLTVRGVDPDTLVQGGTLAARCQNQWGTLTPNGTVAGYKSWAYAASLEVAQAFIAADPLIGGQINVVLQGYGGTGAGAGTVSAAAIQAVTNAFRANGALTDSFNVSAVNSVTYYVHATVYVAAAQLANAIAYINTQLANLSNGIGGAGGLILLLGNPSIGKILSNAPGVTKVENVSIGLPGNTPPFSTVDVVVAAPNFPNFADVSLPANGVTFVTV